MALSDELSAYQSYLEGARAFPADDHLVADLAKARAAMEVAYLEQQRTAGEALIAGPRVPPLSRPFDPEVGLTTDDDAGVW